MRFLRPLFFLYFGPFFWHPPPFPFLCSFLPYFLVFPNFSATFFFSPFFLFSHAIWPRAIGSSDFSPPPLPCFSLLSLMVLWRLFLFMLLVIFGFRLSPALLSFSFRHFSCRSSPSGFRRFLDGRFCVRPLTVMIVCRCLAASRLHCS